MGELLLHLEDIRLPENAGSRSIGGVLYFFVDGYAFPEEGWYELVRVDLENWLPVLLSFARNHTDTCIFWFMDGPYEVKLTRHPGGEVTARFLKNHRPVLPETVIHLPVFLTNVAACVRKLAYTLHEAAPDSFSRDEINALCRVAAELVDAS